MKQDESHCMLDYEELSVFLGEIEMPEPAPLETPASFPSIPTKNTLIHSEKARRYPRVDILTTQQEVTKLQDQLQTLKEKRELREMLEATKSSCRLDWRTFASRERILKTMAIQVNDQFQKHIDMNTQMIQSMVKSIHRQIKTMPKSVQIESRMVSPQNEAHVRRVMQSCLENRSKNQLDAIVNECDGVALEWSSDTETAEWNIFALEDRGVGVDFHESVVLPFNSSFVNSAVGRWPSLNAFEVFKTEGGDISQYQDLWKATGLDRRLIHRRVVSVQGRTIVLWEDAFCLQDNFNSSSVMIRGSGWVLIAPVTGDPDNLSAVHSGGLIQIQASEGGSLQPNDTLTKDIVAYTQLMQRSRITSLEDILIDACQQ